MENIIKLKGIKAVLFDLDGTLIHAKGLIGDCINQTLEEFGYSPIDKNKLRGLIGVPLGRIFEIGGVVNKKDIDEMVKYYRNLYLSIYLEKTKVYDGMFELLTNLKSKGIKIGIVTLKNGDVARKVLKGLEINSLFDIIVGEGDCEESKPSPVQILYSCDLLGIENKDTMVVGDSIVDIKAGKNAGCLSVGVLWGFSTETELKNVGADYLINDIEDFKRFLGIS